MPTPTPTTEREEGLTGQARISHCSSWQVGAGQRGSHFSGKHYQCCLDVIRVLSSMRSPQDMKEESQATNHIASWSMPKQSSFVDKRYIGELLLWIALSNGSLAATCPWAVLDGPKALFVLRSKKNSIMYHLLVSQLGCMMIKRSLMRPVNFSRWKHKVLTFLEMTQMSNCWAQKQPQFALHSGLEARSQGRAPLLTTLI